MNATLRIMVALTGTVGLVGCAHVPAQRVTRDRFDYASALGDSWKRQTLANVVRIRYADAPVFLNVSSVKNSYTLSGTVNASAAIAEKPAPSSAGLGGNASWSNTPTVTYQPLTGDQFSKNLLRPMHPAIVLQLVEAGWPVELIFRTSVRAINGIHNQIGLAGGDPRFFDLLSILGRIQRSDAIGFKVQGPKDAETVVMVITGEEAAPVKEDGQAARKLLGLDPDVAEFNVTYGPVPKNTHEVAILTRSMFEIMLELSAGIDVPPPHLEGQVLPLRAGEGRGSEFKPLVHIRSGPKAPGDAYAAVPYEGYWFWIDTRDIASKRLFTFLMILFSLSESAPAQAVPLVTIPAH